jgi:glucokinase
MGRSIGVVVSSRIVAGLIEDHKLVGSLGSYPANPDDHEALLEHPFESLCHLISDQVLALHPEGKFDAIGVAIPGIIRDGICEDSPNLAQLKGANVAESLAAIFQSKGISAPLKTLNDADAVAAGLAVTQGRTDKLVRVWTIGNGIGFGRYPYVPGVWEGGHTVVTLDPKETYCGC